MLFSATRIAVTLLGESRPVVVIISLSTEIEWHPHKTPDTSCASVCVHPQCFEVGWSRAGRNMRAAFYDYFMMCSGGSMAQCSRYGDQDRLRVLCHTRQINFWLPCHLLYPGFYPHTLSAVICSWIIFGDYLCGFPCLAFFALRWIFAEKKKKIAKMPPQARASFRGAQFRPWYWRSYGLNEVFRFPAYFPNFQSVLTGSGADWALLYWYRGLFPQG